MKSITNHLNPKDFFAQIRMERQKHNGVFFLMEGSTDVRRFEKFLEISNVSVIPCWGKPNVVATIDMVQQAGSEDCLGFVDADFERILRCFAEKDGIVYSKHHDFDMDICTTKVVPRYLSEFAVKERLDSEGGCDAFVDSILESLRPLSAMRFANEKHQLNYSLKNLRLEKFFDGFKVDVDTMINAVSTERFSTEEHKRNMRSQINRYANISVDLKQFTNGHDFIAALGIALQKRIADRLPPQTWRREVEAHLRLAFDHADFYASGLAEKILSWQSTKENLTLLKMVS